MGFATGMMLFMWRMQESVERSILTEHGPGHPKLRPESEIVYEVQIEDRKQDQKTAADPLPAACWEVASTD